MVSLIPLYLGTLLLHQGIFDLLLCNVSLVLGGLQLCLKYAVLLLQVLDLLKTLITLLLHLLQLYILLLDFVDGGIDLLLYDPVLVLHR